MMVYKVSDEDIKDPHTGESLGYLELVRGTGKIIFVQEKISILESDKKQVLRRKLEDNSPFGLKSAFSNIEVIESDQLIPFDHPQVGDQVKPI